MKPTSLRPGDRVINRDGFGVVLTFVRRIPREAGRPARCVFRADEFVGQNGPADNGECIAHDSDVIRRYELAPNGRAPAARARPDTPTDLVRLRDEYTTRGYSANKAVARDAQLVVELIDRVARAEAALSAKAPH